MTDPLVAARLTRLETDLVDLTAELRLVRRPNYPLISIGVVLLGVVPGVFAYMTSSATSPLVVGQIEIKKQFDVALRDQATVNEAIAKLNITVDGLGTAQRRTDETLREVAASARTSQAADAASMLNRANTDVEVGRLETQSVATQVALGEIRAKLVEIETQFTDVERWLTVLYEKTFGARYPSDVPK